MTHIRKNAIRRVESRCPIDHSTGLTSDQTVTLTGIKAQKIGLPTLRRVGYRDPETGHHYEFLTINYKLSANTIAAIYKQRWQVELFFKWIEQNLKIKAFLGNNENAVMTPIWIALCTCLLLAYLKFSAKLGWSLQKMLRLVQLILFIRRNLVALLRGDPPEKNLPVTRQLCLV